MKAMSPLMKTGRFFDAVTLDRNLKLIILFFSTLQLSRSIKQTDAITTKITLLKPHPLPPPPRAFPVLFGNTGKADATFTNYRPRGLI